MAALLHHVRISSVKRLLSNEYLYLVSNNTIRNVIPNARCNLKVSNRYTSVTGGSEINTKGSNCVDRSECRNDEIESRYPETTRDFFGINEYNASTIEIKEPCDSDINYVNYQPTNQSSLGDNVTPIRYGSVRFDSEPTNDFLDKNYFTESIAIREKRKKRDRLSNLLNNVEKDKNVGRSQGDMYDNKQQYNTVSRENVKKSNSNFVEQSVQSNDNFYDGQNHFQSSVESEHYEINMINSETDKNYVDQQYFNTPCDRMQKELSEGNVTAENHSSEDGNTIHCTDKQFTHQENSQQKHTSADVHNRASSNLNFIDQQYFQTNTSDQENKLPVKSSETTHTKNDTRQMKRANKHAKSEVNYFDEQYFGEFREDTVRRSNQKNNGKSKREISFKQDAARVPETRINVGSGTDVQSDAEVKVQSQTPQTAYDVAMQIRKEIRQTTIKSEKENSTRLVDSKGFRVDSKGFRILKEQVPDIFRMPSMEIVKMLQESILYNKNDIVAINKPYGLPSHGGPGVHTSVGQLLPSLARKLDRNLETLHLVHRLDKETTGVMLLARTPQMAWKLQSAFKRREVKKAYWVLTKGVPNPTEGIIDIPMTEGKVLDRHRMVLKPDYTEQTRLVMKKSSMETQEAVTQYCVIASHDSAALIECKPITGVKHQIRVHLAFGLNTPVLGDHKYSHLTKLAPQRLHPNMLQRLNIRQSKVRHLPMHLHAKSLLVPEILDGQNLFVHCRLPKHFYQNMKSLKIKLDR